MCSDCEAASDAEYHLREQARSELVRERHKREALQKKLDIQEKVNADLRNCLVRALQQRQGTIDETPGDGRCLFQKMLPVEIRLKIYKLLLVNPQLDETHWFDETTKFGADFKYGLSTSILQTSQWIHAEASPVLYGSNTFAIIMKRIKNTTSCIPQCALTRYFEDQDGIFKFNTILVFQKIRKWKVYTWDDARPVARLIQELCMVPSIQLEVIVILNQRGVQEKDKSASYKDQMEKVVEVLEVLRRVKSMTIRPAQQVDIPKCLRSQISVFHPEEDAYRVIEAKCMRLAMSKKPVEKVFDMHSRLINYALSFEKDPDTRIDMAPYLPKISKDVNVLSMDIKKNPFQVIRGDLDDNSMNLLSKCETASAYQRHERFKALRNRVLQILEPRYNRIIQAIIELRKFLNESDAVEGTDAFMLDHSFDNNDGDDDDDEMSGMFEGALLAVEKAAKAFERDIPPAVSALIRKHPQKYSLTNDSLRRQQALNKMRLIQEMRDPFHHHYNVFVGCFKIAIDDMIEQLIEIRQARKELLTADVLKGTKCSIDPMADIEVNEQPIDWSLRDGNIFSSGRYWN